MEAQNPKIERKRRSPEQWQLLVDSWRVSGLSQAAFCQRERIALSSFCKWRSRFDQSQDSGGFVELTPATVEAQAPWHIELDLGDGLIVRMARER